MGSFDKRLNKFRAYVWGTKSKQRHRDTFATKSAMNLFEAHVREHGEPPEEKADPKHGEVTLAQMLAAAEAAGGPNKGAWLREKRHTASSRRAFVVRLLGPQKPITAITFEAVQEMVQNLRARPGLKPGTKLSTKTINRHVAAVSGILKYAVQTGKLKVKPALPWQAEGAGRILWLTQADEARMVGWLRGQGWEAEALSVTFLCASGLRWGEFERLAPNDILQWKPAWRVVVEVSKNNTPRIVPVPPSLGAQVREMLVAGARPTYYTMRQRYRAAVKACGMDPRVVIHSCRHTTATRLARLGKNAKLIQKFLGHKTLATTMKYITMNDDMLVDAALELHHTGGETQYFSEAAE